MNKMGIFNNKVSAIVATLVKVRAELEEAVELNREKINKSIGVTLTSITTMNTKIDKAREKQSKVESKQDVVALAARAEIEEAKSWIDSLPQPSTKNNT